MSILVTGSAGHLGEGLMRSLRGAGQPCRGVDVKASPFTDATGTICDRAFVRQSMKGVRAIVHAATLHKPHIATHPAQDFVDTNITGTLLLLEEAVREEVEVFVYTSTTSTFGFALKPPLASPAAWITEDTRTAPKNIYGVTKMAAEQLCEMFARKRLVSAIVLRTGRFFPEPDDNAAIRDNYSAPNAQANELLYRRADIADVVSAHLCALSRAKALGFGRYVVSATTPFQPEDAGLLRINAPSVVRRYFPDYEELFAITGWKMFPAIDRVYDNRRARGELHWQPRYDFAHVLAAIRERKDFRSPLAQAVGVKGYHDGAFADGLYPVADRSP